MGLRRHSVGSRPQKSHRGLCSIPPLRSLPSSTLQNTERRSTERNPLPVTPPPSVHSGTPSQIEGGTATPLRQDHVGKTESSSSPDHQQRGMALICQTYNPQLVFENRGSTARDHLASERTFLAYVRTSLALASTGVALVQLFTIADLTSKSLNVPLGDASRKVQGLARPLGVSTVLMGLIMLIIGTSSGPFSPRPV